MKTWTRNPLKEAICGGPCRKTMHRGDPLLVIAIDGMKSTFRRCAACAGEPVPADLPPLAEPIPIMPTAHIRTGPDALPFDYKLAAAGREPGEDD